MTLTITPSSATVPVHGSVSLVGDGTGWNGPIVQWWVQEAKDNSSTTAGCAFLPTQQPPTDASCPYGYVVIASVNGVPNAATYHAAATAGTYHVIVQVNQPRDLYNTLSVSATAAVTVTP